jgi:hypothetical protein
MKWATSARPILGEPLSLRLIGRRLSTLAITAMLASFMAFGVSDALGSAISARSPTRAQKLTKALTACKKQPKGKLAACVRRAKKKYGPVHPPQLPAVTPPVAAVTPPPAPPAAGPVAPAAPTSAQIEALVCSFYCPILNFTIIERGVPRLGTGVDTTRGGDGVPSDTWIFPLLLSYDKTDPTYFRHIACPSPSEACYPAGYNETYTVTLHWRERTNAQIDAAGGLRIFQQAATETCEPAVVGCGISTGGGA